MLLAVTNSAKHLKIKLLVVRLVMIDMVHLDEARINQPESALFALPVLIGLACSSNLWPVPRIVGCEIGQVGFKSGRNDS